MPRKNPPTHPRPASPLPDPTPAEAEALADNLRRGASRLEAAALAGVPVGSFKTWMRRGKNGPGPCEDLALSLKQAEADAKAKAVACILDAAADPSQWRAAAWWLERRHPQEWMKGGGSADLSRYMHMDDVAKLIKAVAGVVQESITDAALRSAIAGKIRGVVEAARVKRSA
jgi:hypothetical protein